MTSTAPDPTQLRAIPLDAHHIESCLALSAEAGWNQTSKDWQMLLRLGRGFGLVTSQGALVATALALPFAGPFAWISMVLVTASWQRRGLATRLMRSAIETIEAEGRIPMLDATPAGRAVYRELGFVDGWSFARWSTDAANAVAIEPAAVLPVGALQRPIGLDDWSRIEAFDQVVFGADRSPLLRELWQRLPRAAWLIESQGELLGFLLGRDGRTATQLGPLVAQGDAPAQALLTAGLRATTGPVYVDALDTHPGMARMMTQAGFRQQRPFTRMARTAKGQAVDLGQPARYYAVAGPELA